MPEHHVQCYSAQNGFIGNLYLSWVKDMETKSEIIACILRGRKGSRILLAEAMGSCEKIITGTTSLVHFALLAGTCCH